jgi:hypothetical protein
MNSSSSQNSKKKTMVRTCFRDISASNLKITATLVMIPSLIALTFLAGAAMLDMSAAYAQGPTLQGNACKDEPNPQGNLNSNPHCPDEDPETVDEPPIPSSNAAGFNDETNAGSQVESNACENASGPTPPPCIAGSRRR